MKWAIWLCAFFSLSISANDKVRVAVASNFLNTANDLAEMFEKEHNTSVLISAGSTGKHYAQIIHGAPFDVFLAADRQRPIALLDKGIGLSDSRFTYAIGKLSLVSSAELASADPKEMLSQRLFSHLAIANPNIAPYGEGARQTLENLGLWKGLSTKLVKGENVSQALQFVVTQNAQLGFVALSQVKALALSAERYWVVPDALYQPIEQQALLLTEKEQAKLFLAFLRTEQARALIQQQGYGVKDV